MKTVTIEDVCNRNIALARGTNNYEPPISIPSVCRRFLEHYSYHSATTILENWDYIDPSNPERSLFMAIDVFDKICEMETSPSNIKTAARIITEKAIPKVRTGQQTKEFVKMRVARFKTKLHTKFNNRIDDINDKVKDSIGTISANLDKNTSAVATALGRNVSKGVDQLKGKKKEEAVKEANDIIIESFNRAIACDMVLNNQTILNRRYNFDAIVNESQISDEEDLRDCILELCSYIDTYQMPFSHKYNVCIENISYSLYKNGIHFDMPKLVETVTDYFVVNTEDVSIIADKMKLVLENASFVDTVKDVEGIQYIFDKDTNKKLNLSNTLVLQESLSDTFDNIISESKEDKFKKEFEKFKTGVTKTPEKFKGMLRSLYVQSPEDIITETPAILSFIRGYFVVIATTAAMGPVAGLVSFLTDQFIKMKVSRKHLEKCINDYKKEIEKVNEKIKKAKTEDAKERLETYKKELEKGLEKLKDKEDTLYSDEANEKRHEDDYADVFDSDDDLDFDLNFDEQVVRDILTIQSISEALNRYIEVDLALESMIESNIDKLPYEFVPSIVEYVKMNPGVFDKDHLIRIFTERSDELSKKSGIYNRIKSETFSEAAEDLKKFDNLLSDTIGDCFTEVSNYHRLFSGYNAISEAINSMQVLQEMNVKNSLKLASENLKKTMKTLSDKDKIISREIDASFSSVGNAAEKALMNENREAVIRGSLIPPASKIIKRAAAAGVAWAINPAIAIIGVLGSVALSKKLQAKERQLILDDIEIELKMVDRYIRIAEDNNDHKALQNLYKMQRSLQRQQQRIKYKMSVYHGQVTKVTTDKSDDYMDESAIITEDKPIDFIKSTVLNMLDPMGYFHKNKFTDYSYGNITPSNPSNSSNKEIKAVDQVFKDYNNIKNKIRAKKLEIVDKSNSIMVAAMRAQKDEFTNQNIPASLTTVTNDKTGDDITMISLYAPNGEIYCIIVGAYDPRSTKALQRLYLFEVYNIDRGSCFSDGGYLEFRIK